MSSPGGPGPFPLPGDAHDVTEFVRSLRAVKVWAGDPSLQVLRRRTGVATSTLSDAFNPHRRRPPSLDLVRQILHACGAHPSDVAEWEHVWRRLRERAVATDEPDVVPRQLPPDVFGFVGRTHALASLAQQPEQAPATVITGTAGVGKTALAVHWAHRIADRYPDGQLYLDLRGHAGDPTISSSAALSLLLQFLGVPSERIPVDLQLQIGLYRSVLSERRVLVVLDNVTNAAHVRPLLPSGPNCHALITSRDALSGLVVREGAARITLETLPAPESRELLAAHLGADRVAVEPDAAAALAELCAHLPLALRISAANLAGRPSQTIAGVVRELASSDPLGRLHVVGDPESAVASAFDLSYRSLPEGAQHLFRLTGLVPGPEIDREAAAVLLDRDPHDRSDPVPELDELLTAHLMFEPRPGRYRMHDLLSLFARRQVGKDPSGQRDAARHRLLSWYLLNTDQAAGLLFSSPVTENYTELELVGRPRDFASSADAAAWLEAELINLTMAITDTAEHGPAPFAWFLASGLRGVLYAKASVGQQLSVAQTALRAAEAGQDAKGQAMSHLSLGLAASSLSDLKTASAEFEASLQHSLRAGYLRGIELARGNLVNTSLRLGDINATQHHIADLLLLFPAEMTPNKVLVLGNLAMIETIRGDHAKALLLATECLTAVEQAGATRLIMVLKRGLALAHLALNDPVTAEKLLLEAHSIATEVASDIDTFDILAGLVLVCVRTERTQEALVWTKPLLELLDRGVPSYAGDDWAHAAVLETYLAAGLLDEGLAIGEAALKKYDNAGHQLTAVRVRMRLGQIHAALGSATTARHYWGSALPYLIEQKLPERVVVEELLNEESFCGKNS